MQENPHASLDVLGTYYWVRGLTHPLRRGEVAIASTVFVMRARAVMSQVSGSHVLGHSHLTRAATPDLFDKTIMEETSRNVESEWLVPTL